MRQKSVTRAATPEQIVKDIRRATRKHHSAEEKIRVVLEGLRGEYSIAELCRREGIAESLYYSWSKDFLEAGKRRLAGDTARAATSGEVKDLRREVRDMKGLSGILCAGPVNIYWPMNRSPKASSRARTGPALHSTPAAPVSSPLRRD